MTTPTYCIVYSVDPTGTWLYFVYSGQTGQLLCTIADHAMAAALIAHDDQTRLMRMRGAA